MERFHDFKWALDQLEQGKRVTRHWWKNEKYLEMQIWMRKNGPAPIFVSPEFPDKREFVQIKRLLKYDKDGKLLDRDINLQYIVLDDWILFKDAI